MTEPRFELRPHHGLCLCFFRGKGYSKEFVENMTRIQGALAENPLIRLAGNTDAICAACPNNQAGCCRTAEKVARYDREVLRRCGLFQGDVISFRELDKQIRQGILDEGQREAVCGDCQWSALCHLESEEI